MPNDWLAKRVISYAHEGGALEGPASTMFAMSKAVAAGVVGLELDVHRSADGVLVVMHDESVDRTSSAEGRVANLTWDELAQLDNAYWFVPESGEVTSVGLAWDRYLYRGRAPKERAFGVVRFVEVLEAFPEAIINVDIKEALPNADPYEQQVIDEVRAMGATDRVMVASFRDSSLFAVRKYDADIATSAGPGEVSEFYFALVNSMESAIAMAKAAPYVAFQIPRYYGEIELPTEHFIDAAHQAGKAVHVWTVNDPKEMELLLDRGVDGIISDRPSVLARVLRADGRGYRPGAIHTPERPVPRTLP